MRREFATLCSACRCRQDRSGWVFQGVMGWWRELEKKAIYDFCRATRLHVPISLATLPPTNRDSEGNLRDKVGAVANDVL